MTLIQDMVKFNGPTKSKMCLKILKEKYFINLTMYNFIFQIKKNYKLYIFSNTLCPILTTNTGLAVKPLTMNIGLAINTLTKNKTCRDFSLQTACEILVETY